MNEALRLSTLIPIHSSRLTASVSVQSPKMYPTDMHSLPIEIYRMIAKSLCTHCSRTEKVYTLSKITLYNLCLVDKKWHQAATPSLYHAFETSYDTNSILFGSSHDKAFESSQDKTFLAFLHTLIQHPNLAIHVKSLRLRPTYREWSWGNMKALRNDIRFRALALGSPFSDHPELLADSNSNYLSRDCRGVLEEMLLLHTPNIVSIDFDWGAVEVDVHNIFKYLNTVAHCSQKWHGMRRLRHVKLDMRFPRNTPESHMTYLSRLATVAPSVQRLHTNLVNSLFPNWQDMDDASSNYWAPVAVQLQIPTPTHIVTFLSSLRSIYIANFTGDVSFERTLGTHIGHCKSVEEVRYVSKSRYAASFVQLIKPLSRTLKRFGLTQCYPRDNETIWDAPHDDSVAVVKAIAGLTSLEALRFDMAGSMSIFGHQESESASMLIPLICALPKSLRVLAIGGCKWVCLKQGLSQLMDRVQDGMLPNFRTLHVTCWIRTHYNPFIEAFADLGIEMVIHSQMEHPLGPNGLFSEGWTHMVEGRFS
ncbi:uncharacterized protein LY79DRAFT_550971 [Colletotrichum navitas]|uniref:F-box domain-containing protein n=1 Tax=Colletotrichum navitas TaxID=681940 RepID=A0AAD8Q2U6_9PEZI|nr:uncharacterized protein LY79DRAFT_550971 [Colletotrichum navitas]KAK1593804.1 hypothetical protein LY79DRAFT_550971 [Colletotrichum navitas]